MNFMKRQCPAVLTFFPKEHRLHCYMSAIFQHWKNHLSVASQRGATATTFIILDKEINSQKYIVLITNLSKEKRTAENSDAHISVNNSVISCYIYASAKWGETIVEMEPLFSSDASPGNL